MKPIIFRCQETLPLAPGEIAQQILDLPKWTEFSGFGPLPGIKAATFETQTQAVVGTRIKVTNTDGSSHVEEIVAWDPERLVQLEFTDFSPPVSRLASKFEEVWQFERVGNSTRVVRLFRLYPKSTLARLVLWLISFLLKQAITRHLTQLRRAAEQPPKS